MEAVDATHQHGNIKDDDYVSYLDRIRDRFTRMTNAHDNQLFTTNVDKVIWDLYLNEMPETSRQYHNCHACKKFIETYGSLVVIGNTGIQYSAIWDEIDVDVDAEIRAVKAIKARLDTARVTGVFLSDKKVWGNFITGDWRHLSVMPQANLVYADPTRTPHQAMSEKREDYINVDRVLREFGKPVLARTLAILNTNSIQRSEIVHAQLDWLVDLQHRLSATGRNKRHNLIWKAISMAPAGFCHTRSSVLGSLLKDVKDGKTFIETSRSFASKVNPIEYQRPQTAPNKENIKQAEKIVAKMKIAKSLQRRFARLDEIETLWKQRAELESVLDGASIFGHLKTKDEVELTDMSVPPTVITWTKFREKVLPDANSIKYWVTAGLGNYAAIVTAVDPDAPPILQWDSPDARNPFSLYVYERGSRHEQWGLLPEAYCTVSAIALRPAHWQPGFTHQAEGAVFILEGAKDSKNNSLALFPSTLKSELHNIRQTIEAFSNEGTLEGFGEASACGILVGREKGMGERETLKVELGSGVSAIYIIDRWD